MRLEMGTFPVQRLAFGPRTRWAAGTLEVDRDAVLHRVRQDPRIVSAALELAAPGESVRVFPVRDVIEPRIKVEGAGVCYPGICGRPVTTVGEGRTHRLAGMAVVEVSDTLQHDGAIVFNETYLDLSGPYAELFPHGRLHLLCLVAAADPALGIEARNDALHNATLTMCDAVAEAVRALEPPEREVFELAPADPALPRVVYIQCINSPQSKSGGSPTAFGPGTYGLTRLAPPWLLHPNEVLDGALTGPYRTPFDMSWATANNPLLLELLRRHGRDWAFVGVIVQRTEWTSMAEKQLVANQAAKLARLLGAQGALVTWDAGGNDFVEVMRTAQACERLGIKTVFLTSEDDSLDGHSTMLEPLPEVDAIVSTGFFVSSSMGLPEAPAMERVIGLPEKPAQADRRVAATGAWATVPTGSRLAPAWRYDDHYGFNSLSCIE